MGSRSRIRSLPWKVPSTIIVSFLAAILLAFGHHLFYQSLAGTPVHKAALSQQFNVAVGTAFAFIVRALLVLSIGTTYWQIFWRTLRAETLTVANINTLFSLLHNAFSFVKVGPLFWHPLLVAIAILSWTVPIAMIVPPATLSVRSEIVTSHQFKTMDVPVFETGSMAQVRGSKGDKPQTDKVTNTSSIPLHGCDYDGDFILYNAPSQPLSRMTMATAYQGVLPNVANSPTNASYTLSFNAPATRCESAPKSILSQLGAFAIGGGEGVPDHYYIPQYISWTPTTSEVVPSNLKNIAEMQLNQITYNSISGSTINGTYGLSPFLGQYQDLQPSLFIAWSSYNKYASLYVREALNCSFYNATYTANFEFTNGEQKINITSVKLLDDRLKLSVPISNNCKKGSETGTIITGEQVGYQAMIDALGRALVGTIGFSQGQIQPTDPLVVDQTSVMKTNLAYSNDLARLYAASQTVGIKSNENPLLLEAALNASSVPHTGLSLATSIERLFQNMTLSLFSDTSMLAQSPNPTKLELRKTENVYAYSWSKLVLAYGIAVFVTLLTVVVGCLILLANGAAYSSDFSTFMRLIRGQHIDDVVAAHDDRDGADPLPKALAEAKIHIESAAMSSGREEKDQSWIRGVSNAQDSDYESHRRGFAFHNSRTNSESPLISR